MEKPPKLDEPFEHEVLPPLYDRWINSFLGPIPREKMASCDDCAMCTDGQDMQNNGEIGVSFRSDTKCCTYLPSLPNFLVGRILSDKTGHPAGLKSIKKRIEKRVAVTPLGVAMTPLYGYLYYQNAQASFGRTKVFMCPHYMEDTKQCGIWQNRNAVCSTYFCKHMRAQTGRAFWQDGLLPLLKYVEESLSYWCAQQLDLGEESFAKLLKNPTSVPGPSTLTTNELEDKIDPTLYSALWGKWLNKEEQYYRETSQLISELSWKEVQKICGPRFKPLENIAKESYKKLLSESLPKKLYFSGITVTLLTKDQMRVANPKGYESFDLDLDILKVLHQFDGRPLQTVLDSIKTDHHCELDHEAIQLLMDLGILSSREGS